MMKKSYEKPQMRVVQVKQMSIICTSFNSVQVNTVEEMGEYDEFE